MSDRPRGCGCNSKSKRPRIPSRDKSICRKTDPESTLEFMLGIEDTDWKIEGNWTGVSNDIKVTHFDLKYTGSPGECPICGGMMSFYDHKPRQWRHANMDNVVCYIDAEVPRVRCEKCKTTHQINVPWANPNVSYSKRFCEVALMNMASMSLLATARTMMCSWKLLDDIVGRFVDDYLSTMDLLNLEKIRVDETSAKKHHKYITVITDADTNDIVYITKGKDSDTIAEFKAWLIKHNGDPENIKLVSSDLGDAFVKGVRENFPNADNVFDPFHVINLANDKMDKDRTANQMKGDGIKNNRFLLLKNDDKLTDEERARVMHVQDINKTIGTSYQMNITLRELYRIKNVQFAKDYLRSWLQWVKEDGSSNFKTLAKTIEAKFDGIIRAIETGLNNGFQESLNGRVQFSKRIANGYRKEMRLGRIVYFRQAAKKYLRSHGLWDIGDEYARSEPYLG